MDHLINCCRLCLEKSSPHHVNCLDFHELLKGVRELFGFQIRQNDVFSTRICKECIEKVSRLAMYRSCVLNNQKNIARYHALQSKILEVKQEEDKQDVVYVSTIFGQVKESELGEVSSTQFPSKKFAVKYFARKSTAKLSSNIIKKSKICKKILKVQCSALEEKDVKDVYLSRYDQKILKLRGKQRPLQAKEHKNLGKIVQPIWLKLSKSGYETKKCEASTSEISMELPEDEIPLKKIQEKLAMSKNVTPSIGNVVIKKNSSPLINFRKTVVPKSNLVPCETNSTNKFNDNTNNKAITPSNTEKQLSLKEIAPAPKVPIARARTSEYIPPRNKNVPPANPIILPNLPNSNPPSNNIIVNVPNSVPVCPPTSGTLLFLTGNNMPVLTNSLQSFQTIQNNTMNCMQPMNIVTSTTNTNLTITNPRTISYQANNINNNNTLIFEDYIPFDSLFQKQVPVVTQANRAPIVINDPKVKVLSVNELNMRVGTCTNDNNNTNTNTNINTNTKINTKTNNSNALQRKLPIRITLIRNRNEMIIKLADSRNQEMHFTSLSDAEKKAVRNSLLGEESRKQFEAAMVSCHPDAYSLELLNSLNLTQTSFIPPFNNSL